MSKDAHATSKAAHKDILEGRAGFLTRHCLSDVGPREPAWLVLFSWSTGEPKGACFAVSI